MHGLIHQEESVGIDMGGVIDMTVVPVALLIVLAIGVGFLLLLAALVKHGYGKALAIVLGGALCLFVVMALFLNVAKDVTDVNISEQPELSTGEKTFLDVIGEPKINLDKTVTVSSKTTVADVTMVEPESEKEPDEADSDLAVSENVEHDLGNKNSTLHDSKQSLDEWIASKPSDKGVCFTAEPYLGNALNSRGKPTGAVRVDLTNQLIDWMTQKVPSLVTTHANKQGQTIQEVPFTTSDEIWQRLVADYHVDKQSTSVGDTETLSIYVPSDQARMTWIENLARSQQATWAQANSLRLYTFGGGGVFLGLVALYGLLSIGSKGTESTTTND